MKRIILIILLLVLSIFLISCSNISEDINNILENITQKDETSNDKTSESNTIADTKDSNEDEKAKYNEDILKSDEIVTINLYGFNDFHGAVNEDGNRVGLAYMASYLKSVGEQENTLTIDSGDTWQGSIESNYNRGALITDVFNYAKVDIKTLGNHDFDWGQEYIKLNSSKIYDDYQTPVLAANVYDYDWDSKKEGNVQQSSLGKEYVTYTLENGVKVGIVGVIGSDQITSISTQMVKNICFKNHVETIKQISDILRTKENCDIVICSLHASQNDVLSTGITNISSVSGKKYVDVCFCAHTHQKEFCYENDTLFIQAGAYGTTIANVTLKYNKSKNCITEISHEYISANEIKRTKIDSKILEIIDEYYCECKKASEEVISTKMSGSFYSSEQIPNMLCKAIYEEAKAEGYDIDLAYVNVARASIYSSTWTYGDIYEALPFDNIVYIAQVKGSDVKDEIANYNYIYRSNDLTEYIDSDETYTIAVIDYLAFHTNSKRNYDYFKTIEVIDYLKKNDEAYLYRDILADWLKKQNDTIYASDYSSNLWNYNRGLLICNWF